MKKLMDSIGETVRELVTKANLDPLGNEVRKYILREFAEKGKAPTPEKIVKELRLSSTKQVKEIIEKLEKADILQKREDQIISAYPFSAYKTRHKVIFPDGNRVYALCATDALGIHFMLDKDITVVSRCPQCGKEMIILVKAGRIDSHSPTKIIEFVSNRERGGCTAETLCPFINFFCSKEHLQQWRERNPDYRNGEIYSLKEALEHGRYIFGNFLK